MSILYKANETDFTHFGFGPLNDAVSILVTEERNGIFELEMKYPVSGGRFKDLKNDRIIKADAGHNLKDQRFKIIRITKPLKGIVTVHAEHVSYLSQDLALKPKVTFSGNAQQALSTWKANLIDDNPFIVSSDITTTSGGTWTIDEVENPRRALGGVSGSILDKYGGEYRFDNYQIRLMRQRGVNSAALIAYGRNLTDLTQEEEIANTYTSIYPYAVYRDDDGNEHLLTLPEFYIDSEHVNNFARRKILAVDFSQDEIKTVTALRSAANTYITANSVGVPKVNLKISYVDLAKTLDYKNQAVLEEVNLCDNVPVYFEKFGINTTAKAIKVVWDDIRKHYDSVEIGEARSSLSQAINTTVDGRVSHVEKKVNIIQLQADGMKLIYRQVDRPPNGSHAGDLWYQPNGIYEIMYQWDGSDWKEILNTQDLDAIKREVTAAVAQADADRAQAEVDINQALTDAQEYTEAKAQAFDSQMVIVKGDVATASAKADDSIIKSEQAIEEAGFAKTEASAASITSATAIGIAQAAALKADESIGQSVSALSLAEQSNNLFYDKQILSRDTGERLIYTKAEIDGPNGLVNKADYTRDADVWSNELSRVEGVALASGANINLLVRKSEIDGMFLDEKGIQAVWLTYAIMKEYIPVTEGEKITFSKQSGNMYWAWRRIDGSFISRNSITTAEKTTDTAPIGARFLHVSYLKEGYPKAERGIVKTQWVLAPQDQVNQSNINYLEGRINQTAEQLESVYTKTEVDNSLINKLNITTHQSFATQTAESISQMLTKVDEKASTVQFNSLDSLVSGTIQRVGNSEGRITQVETNVNGLQNTVGDSNSGLVSQTSQITKGLQAVVSSGFNLVLNPNFENGATNWSSGIQVMNATQTIPVKYYGRMAQRDIYNENEFSTTSGEQFEVSGYIWQLYNQNVNFGIRFTLLDGTRVWKTAGSFSDLKYDTSYRIGKVVAPKNAVSGCFWLSIDQYTNFNSLFFSKIEVTKHASQSQVTLMQDDINLRVSKGETLSQINIESGRILIQTGQLYLDTASTYMTTAYVNDLKAKSLEAVYADIATLKTKVLTADVVTSTHIKADAAFIDKIFINDAQINRLTSKAAFITSVKAIDITADKITGGTFNGATMNIINLNASSIASGTVRGANSFWDLGTGLIQTRLPGTTTRAELDGGIVRSYSDRYGTAEINGGRMDYALNETRIGINPLNIYFSNGSNIRNLMWTSEGIMTQPGPMNTGTDKNSSFHIKGLGAGSVQYLQFVSGDGINMRVQGSGNDLTLMHAPSGAVKIAPYGGDDTKGILQAANFQTIHPSGGSLTLVGDRLETPRFNNRNIYLIPNGTGSVVIGNAGGTRYNIVASDFVKQSTRASKTDIRPMADGVLSAIHQLRPVTYRKKDKLERGINEIEKGFIAEDNPLIATPDGQGIYDSHITAYLVKGVQEMDLEIKQLKQKIAELERNIE